MIINSVIVHEQNPGSSPASLQERLDSLSIPSEQVGVEMDVDLKRLQSNEERVAVAISRDGRMRVPVENHIQAFVDRGFKGPFFLDITHRRAPHVILQSVMSDPNIAESSVWNNVLIQVPEMAMSYKTPWGRNQGHFKVENFWSDAWDRLTVTSRLADLAREFTREGCKINLFWEPIDDAIYRANRKDLVQQSRMILYKMPQLCYSAKFDPLKCLERDLDFFNSIPEEVIVVPMGSVEIIQEHKRSLSLGHEEPR